MSLTHAQKTGLEAAIVAHLAAEEGERFARTVAAFKEEAQLPGGGGGGGEDSEDHVLCGLVSGLVLDKAWNKFTQKCVQTTGLEAAIVAYLAAEGGGRFARTVAAFKEEAQLPGGSHEGNLVVGGTVLEKAWLSVLEDGPTISAIFDAIESGDLAEVQLYELAGVDVKAMRHSAQAISPLFWASLHNRIQIVQCFLRSGHDVDLGDRDGTTPLFVAAQEGHFEVVQCLVEHGADKVKAMIKGAFPLFMAAMNGHLTVVRYLVEQGSDKDKTADGGETPVCIAAQNGHFTVVQYLVEQGADTDKATVEGATPLFSAARSGHAVVVQYLAEHGADKEKANEHGMTPLSAACHNGHDNIVETLLDLGSNVNHVSVDGYTTLHCAAAASHLKVARVLFRYGVKLDARCIDGFTAADIAISIGDHAFADAIRAEEIRRRDHGFKRDRSTIEGTEEHEASKRPRVQEVAAAADESDDDDDDDDDDEDDDGDDQ